MVLPTEHVIPIVALGICRGDSKEDTSVESHLSFRVLEVHLGEVSGEEGPL